LDDERIELDANDKNTGEDKRPVLLRIKPSLDQHFVRQAAEQSLACGKTITKNAVMVQVLENSVTRIPGE